MSATTAKHGFIAICDALPGPRCFRDAARALSQPTAYGLALLTLVLLRPAASTAQQNQFGGQARADAARRMIVLGVEQGIASLPPPSGQAFRYEYDPVHDTYVRSQRLGPTALRATEPVGAGRISLRVSVSYFELSGSYGPLTYGVEPEDPSASGSRGLTEIGLDAQARVGLTNFAVSYGVTNRFELTFNVPLVIVDAQASQAFTTRAEAATLPANQAVLSGAPTLADLNGALDAGQLVFRKEKFSALGFDFNDGAHVGVGRISVGAKGVAYSGKHLQVALASEFFLPSPNENEFAGSATPATLARIISAVPVTSFLKLRMDAGYDYDFDTAELRRFLWNVGGSVAMHSVSFDLGVGGSNFDEAIRWTPSVAHGVATPSFQATKLTALGDNRLGDTFVDFLSGIKLRITERTALSGSVNVPVNNEGFRPVALGTLALESYF